MTNSFGSIHPLESSKSTRHTPCYKETFKLPVLTQGPMSLFLRMFGDLFGVLKLPLKIENFVWKLMLDSLPTFLNLSSREINVHSTCPLCNSEVESSTHLFLYCEFARAIWHGSALNIHTSNLNDISVQGWLSSLLLRYKRMTQPFTDPNPTRG